MLANIEKAGTSFTNGGGWNSWLQMTTQPQNNAFGAYLIEKSEYDDKIATNQNSASAELSFGQGSLSYKDCYNITYDKDGNQVSSDADSPSKHFSAPAYTKVPTTYSGTNTVVPTCTVSTPGAVVTSMLSAKANSSQTQMDLQASLSNGIDSILGALESSLETKIATELKNGILGDNSTAENNYNNDLEKAVEKVEKEYGGFDFKLVRCGWFIRH